MSRFQAFEPFDAHTVTKRERESRVYVSTIKKTLPISFSVEPPTFWCKVYFLCTIHACNVYYWFIVSFSFGCYCIAAAGGAKILL